MCLIWRNWIDKAQESTKQCAERGKIIQTSLWCKAFYMDWKHTYINFCLLPRANLQILALALANISAADWQEFGVHTVYWAVLFIFQLHWSWVEGRGAPCPQYDHTGTKGLLLCGSESGENGDRDSSQPWQGAWLCSTQSSTQHMQEHQGSQSRASDAFCAPLRVSSRASNQNTYIAVFRGTNRTTSHRYTSTKHCCNPTLSV